MTAREYIEQHGADGYVEPLEAEKAANPEALAQWVAAGRLAAFTPPQAGPDGLESDGVMWTPQIAGYPWWMVRLIWEQAPELPALPAYNSDVELPRGFELPAYSVRRPLWGAQAPLLAHRIQRMALGFYWRTDPKAIFAARAPWDASAKGGKDNG